MRIRILRAGNSMSRQQGFTYMVILVALVVIGILAEVATLSSAKQKQRVTEQELLFRGKAYLEAIKSYYLSSPVRQYPKHIDDLLYDNRFAYKRHLRQLYPEPVSGGEWKLLHNSSGAIVGVASHDQSRPLKQSGFYPPFEHFADAEHYSQWTFLYQPTTAAKTVERRSK